MDVGITLKHYMIGSLTEMIIYGILVHEIVSIISM